MAIAPFCYRNEERVASGLLVLAGLVGIGLAWTGRPTLAILTAGDSGPSWFITNVWALTLQAAVVAVGGGLAILGNASVPAFIAAAAGMLAVTPVGLVTFGPALMTMALVIRFHYWCYRSGPTFPNVGRGSPSADGR